MTVIQCEFHCVERLIPQPLEVEVTSSRWVVLIVCEAQPSWPVLRSR